MYLATTAIENNISDVVLWELYFFHAVPEDGVLDAWGHRGVQARCERHRLSGNVLLVVPVLLYYRFPNRLWTSYYDDHIND